MIEYLLAANALIIYIYAYRKTKGIFLTKLRLLFSGLICSLSTLFSYMMYFYLYKNRDIIFIGIIFIGLLLIMKKYLLDKNKLSDRVTYLFSLLMNNAIIISVSFIALYITVVKIFPGIFIIYQLLIMIVGEILLYFVRRMWGKMQTASFSMMIFVIVIVTIFMYSNQYKYSDSYIPNSSAPYHMTLNFEKIAPAFQGFPMIDISVSDDFLYYTQYMGGINQIYLLKAYDLTTHEFENIYFTAKSSTIINPMIELIDYQGEVLISSAMGVFRVEGNTVVALIENTQADTLQQYMDYFQVIYLLDDQLIYENQDGVFTYVDHEFIETTNIPSVQLEGYIPISFYLDYYYFSDTQPIYLENLMNKDYDIINEDLPWSFICASSALRDTVTSYDTYNQIDVYYNDLIERSVPVLISYENINYHLSIGDIRFYQHEDLIWSMVTTDLNRQNAYLLEMTYAQVIRDGHYDYLISDGVYRVNEPVLALSETPFYKIKNIVFITLFIACLPLNLVSLEAMESKEKSKEES